MSSSASPAPSRRKALLSLGVLALLTGIVVFIFREHWAEISEALSRLTLGQGLLVVRVDGDRDLLEGLHVHDEGLVVAEGQDLSLPLVDDRHLDLGAHRSHDGLLRAGEDADGVHVRFRGPVLSGLGGRDLDDLAGLVVDVAVPALFQPPDLFHLPHWTHSLILMKAPCRSRPEVHPRDGGVDTHVLGGHAIWLTPTPLCEY